MNCDFFLKELKNMSSKHRNIALILIVILILAALGKRADKGSMVATVTPTATAMPTAAATSTPETSAPETSMKAVATPTAEPTTTDQVYDYEAAWEVFLEVIYRCDAMPDLGDDLGLYPSLEEFDALHNGIEELTTDTAWQDWCEQRQVIKRLAQFGPRNLECEGATCEAVVSVQSQGGLANYQGEMVVARPPKYQDLAPFRLLRGTVEFQEERWIVTKIEVEILPPPTEDLDLHLNDYY